MSDNKLLNTYIKTLIPYLNINNIPKNIDLVFDGGAFNGGMGFGIAHYIKQLENKKHLTVNRISGCSIGSVIALSYFINMEYEINDIFVSICNNFKRTFNLSVFEKHVKKFIYKYLTDDLSELNNKLYITYCDANNYKQIVVSKYNNREHLLKCIMRSCHIPYITSSVMKYENKYIDGILPYVFIDGERPVLFVKLITILNYKRIFNIKNEKNIYERMLIGIEDIHSFLTNEHSDMCSYYNNWSIISICLIKLRLFIFFNILWLLDMGSDLKEYIPVKILDSSFSHNIFLLLTDLYSNIMYKIIN